MDTNVMTLNMSHEENKSKPTKPLKAIKERCIDCCGGSFYEVKLCTAKRCALYPFRLGKNPFSKKRKQLTDDQRKDLVERLTEGRKKKDNE